MPGTCAVELRNITKRLGSVVANSGIDLEINRGEILSLLGAICGIVGFITVSGANHTLYSGDANGVGFTSITVTWLNAAY